MLRLVSIAVLLMVTALVSTAAAAMPASSWAATEHGAVRLVAGITAVGDRASVPLGLQFRMQPGWHIYWRTPGDAGYPPRLDWQGSENLAGATIAWPAPQRFSVLGLETVGYADAVILPIAARPERPGEAMLLRATVDYLTCAEICVPYVAELALELPAGTAAPSALAHDIARAVAMVPGAEGRGLALTGIRAVSGGDDPKLELQIRSDTPLTSPDAFIEGPSPIAFSAPQVSRSAGGREATLSVTAYNVEAPVASLVQMPLTVTIVDGPRSLERVVTVEAAEASQPGSDDSVLGASRGLLVVLSFALLGGLVLNLMPCVLPVLSMKLLAVVGHGGGDRRQVRAGFIATAAGILGAFVILAGALIALQASGSALGWGVQFQQPWFLITMVVIVTLFAGNLWGLFDIALPRALAVAGERAGLAPGLAGHFLTGVLATLLATPCSAPFLGTAIGFALSRGPLEIMVIFVTIGIGLAAPYLLVAAVPSLATRLPKPGRWMIILRRFLGVALAGTAVWLLWVLAGRIGWPSALLVAAIALLVLAVVALRSLLPAGIRPVALLASIALVAGGFALPSQPREHASTGSDVPWQPFAPERIPALVEEGRTVFVNVTADWCLTCKVNERVVLAREPVRSHLASDQIVAMRGDWTAPDDAIARYLALFGRYGIPFDAVYGPTMPAGKALPELLTERVVLEALTSAGGATAQR